MGAAEVIASEEVRPRKQWSTLRQQLNGGIAETVVAHAHAGERQRQQASCPKCARVLKVQEQGWRTVETMVVLVALQRPYVYCRSCRVGLYPLDGARGLVAGCKQLDRQRGAVNLVTE